MYPVGMAMNTCAAEHYEATFQSCTFVRKTNQRLHVPVLLQLQLLNYAEWWTFLCERHGRVHIIE